MKRIGAFALALLCAASLTGCQSRPADASRSTDASPSSQSSSSPLPQSSQPEVLAVLDHFRIVDGAQSGRLVLAGEGENDVLTLDVENIPVFLDGKEADPSVLEDGMMAQISHSGDILETWPAQFGSVSSIRVYSQGSAENPAGTTYDLCGLYLKVLSDLWSADAGLNDGVEYISVDLSQAPGDLTEGEKAAIAWIFAGQHGAQPLTLSYGELAAEGYLDEISLGGEDSSMTAGNKLYQWEDGLLFIIAATEPQEEETYSLPVVNFDAHKWRTPLGTYYFFDCTAVWPQLGSWSGYEVGSEMIS